MIKKRKLIQVGSYGVNCALVETDRATYIIDPGSDAAEILAALRKNGLAPTAILLTHAHFDHIGAIEEIQKAYPGLPVYVGEKDVPFLGHPMNVCPPDYPSTPKPANIRMADGEEGPDGVKVLKTPGHTPGGVCYWFEADNLLFSGDTLFAGSVGRTDFPGGDMATLMASLATLKALPDETVVVPGHGPLTTIGREKDSNIYLQQP